MTNLKEGDIVTLIDRGDFRAEVSYIPENHNGCVQLSFFEDGVEHQAFAKISELSLVCRMANTKKIQLLALNTYAASRGYFPSFDNNFISMLSKTDQRFISFNNMVRDYNSRNDGGNRYLEKIKLQYSKKTRTIKTQSNWIKYRE